MLSCGMRMRYLLMIICLPLWLISVTAPTLAASECDCSGQARLFSVSPQFVEIRMGKAVQASSRRCRWLEGEIKRLFTQGGAIPDQPVVNRLSPDSYWLRKQPLGASIRFHCTMTRRGTVDEVIWTVE